MARGREEGGAWPAVLPQGTTGRTTMSKGHVQTSYTEGSRTHPRRVAGETATTYHQCLWHLQTCLLELQTDRQAHSHFLLKRSSYKLQLTSHLPTNHIDNPVYVLAQSDIDPWPSGAATADPPAHQSRQHVLFSNLAGQRTSRVSLHIKLKISVVMPECQFHPFILPGKHRLLPLPFQHRTCCPSSFLGSTHCIAN